HVGPYDDEGPVLQRMHTEFIADAGLSLTGRHHEIYLSDPRRTDPSRLRTILRQPVTDACVASAPLAEVVDRAVAATDLQVGAVLDRAGQPTLRAAEGTEPVQARGGERRHRRGQGAAGAVRRGAVQAPPGHGSDLVAGDDRVASRGARQV